MQKIGELKERKVLVLGLGVSGAAAASFLLSRGAKVTGVDKNAQLPLVHPPVAQLLARGMIFKNEENIDNPADFDLVIVSPGIPPAHPLYRMAQKRGIEVIGEAELALREVSVPCLAVTGTNGKTTVTLLTTHILQSSGIRAIALGNVGTPLTAALEKVNSEQADVFVIELSSFQLETLTTRFIDTGVILNITPDHLDRYESIEDYAKAKTGMEKNLKEGGKLFVENQCLSRFGSFFKHKAHASYGFAEGDSLFSDLIEVYFENNRIFSLPKIFGGKRSHETENMMAAFALCHSLSISPKNFLIGLASFQKPPHRIEFIKTIGGVNFYDDSKGTNIDAVIRAVECLEGEIILIAGGVDKGFPYTSWIDAFGGKVKMVCAIGESKEKIQNDLKTSMPVKIFSTLDQAVAYAAHLAKPGDNVLFSPGCSSFDMFKDYIHRGLEFQRLINAL